MTSKEALIYLLNMARNPRCSMIVNESGKYTKEELLNIVNQDLDRVEKLEKAIETLINKRVSVGLLLRQSLFSYNFIKPKDKLTQEEYDLLKEVIKNAK